MMKHFKIINKLVTKVEVKSYYGVYTSIKTISFDDELVGVGCLVPPHISDRLPFAIFQTVPDFVRHTVRRYQSLRLGYLINSITLSANVLRNNNINNPDSTFWLESSVSTMLNYTVNVEMQGS
jgi:hypothetical protein